MDSRYNSQLTEDAIYKLWEENDAFNPDSVKKLRENNKAKVSQKKFSIIMPPPNANDPLHVGHAMFVSIEDIMVRYHRMLGEDTVWIPGTDHAGIETQFVFEKKLKKEAKSRFNFDRSTLFKMICDFVQENYEFANDQIKKLGASADWSRFKFTLDKDIVENVLGSFMNLYKDGLIYRDLKLVNYCINCGTSYSELEVNHEEKQDPLYTIQYGPLQVSTVRLETIFGDVAVAVNPKDKRYKKFIGTKIEVEYPWGKKVVPVIADNYVDPEFGTGAVKVTPYHDQNDFRMWEDHKDEIDEKPLPIINTKGKIYNSPEKYNGLGIVNARKQVLDDYQSYKDSNGNSLLVSIDKNYKHALSVCYRCSRQIEPLPLPQLFIRVADSSKKDFNLVKNALESIETGETEIYGAGRKTILVNWLKNLKDWNISRQIVWGIPIPIWYKINGNEDKITAGFINNSGEFQTGTLKELLKENSIEKIKEKIQIITAEISVPYSVSIEDPTKNDGSEKYIQETDTFDTWFSSSQWPVVTLKTNLKNDFERFYPTSVMETGYDILPIWVMRMMLLGSYLTKKSPFEKVYLHGLVRDEKGKKMSKSKGNVINPLSVKQEFGADALRMALVIRSTPGLDKSVGSPDFKAMRNLTNKIWNAARFAMLMFESTKDPSLKSPQDQIETEDERVKSLNEQIKTKNAPGDAEFINKLNDVILQTTNHLSDLKIGLAAETVYNEFWHWFCDICIEETKKGNISLEKTKTGLIVFLKLLHPFMPFVTEAIWQELLEKKMVNEKLLIVSDWPTPLS